MRMTDLFSPERKKWALMGIAALAAAGIIGSQFFSTRTQGTSAAKITDTRPAVEVKVLQKSDMVRPVILVGQTVPAAQVDIVAKYSGRVVAVNAELGQAVTNGQVLLVQDIGDVDLAMAQADAARQQAEADAAETAVTFDANYNKALVDYQHSQASFERYQSLYEMGAISRDAFDTMQQQLLNDKATLDSFSKQSPGGSTPAAVEAKRAAVIKAERNLAALAKQRDDMVIRAPRDGMIGYRQVEVGAFIQPGQKILSIVDNSSIYVDCQVSEQDVAFLKLGTTAQLQLEALGNSYTGHIIYISPALDAQNRAFTVRLQLNQPGAAIKSGMFVRSRLEVMQKAQILFVNKEAVMEKNGQFSVYVLDGQNKVVQRKITIGVRNDREVEIINGVQEGESVIISNLSRLKPGMEVTVRAPENAGNPGGNEV